MEMFFFFRNLLYPGIKFNKLVTNIGMYISIILFMEIYKYNFKQTLPRATPLKILIKPRLSINCYEIM